MFSLVFYARSDRKGSFFNCFFWVGLLQYNLKLHESKFYLKQIIELRSSKPTFFVVANNTVFLFYDYIESVNLVFIFLSFGFFEQCSIIKEFANRQTR